MGPGRSPSDKVPDPTRFLGSQSSPVLPSSPTSGYDIATGYPDELSRQSLVSQEHAEAMYDYYQINVTTRDWTGLDGAPVAAAKGNGKAAVFRQHGGYGELVVEWTAARLFKFPTLPHWNIPNPLYVLKYKEIKTFAPEVMQDGYYELFRANGIYLYILQEPMNDTSIIPIATTRVMRTNPSYYMVNGSTNFSPEPLNFLSNVSVSPITY